MPDGYDVIVIGTGVAATVIADRCAAAGRSAAVIDSRDYGGTCALRGCDPKKVLWGAADAADTALRLSGHGLADPPRVDWPALLAFKKSFTDPIPEAREGHFRSAGIDTLHGVAKFVGRNALRVDDRVLEARHIVLACGARPVPLPIDGAEHLTTSDGFLDLADLPGTIAFVGGGFVSFEFAHIAARAGARPTILHRGERPLEQFDADLVARLLERTRAVGIQVHLHTEVKSVRRGPGAYLVEAVTAGAQWDMAAALVVHGAGRAPALDDLDLEAGGVARVGHRLALNPCLQSVSNPAVYAAGDAAQAGPPLTPVASLDGETVAANILDGRSRRSDYTGVPSVVFTIPPLAAVGLTEEEATRRLGRTVCIHAGDMAGWFMARRLREPAAAFKVLVDQETGRVLGAHILGPQAEETINFFALAMRLGLTVEDLLKLVSAYPSAASIIASMLSASSRQGGG